LKTEKVSKIFVKTNFRTLQQFAQVAEQYARRHRQAEGANNGATTKIEYALNRVLGQVRKYHERIQEQLTDAEIDHCVVDASEVIQRDASGNLQFTREGIKTRNRLHREILERRDLEIDPYYLAEAPADLSELERAIFTGFVLRPLEVAEPPDPGGC
jgi:hypothetical protein